MGANVIDRAYPSLVLSGLPLVTRSDLALAKRHYRQGVRSFRRGRFEEAIANFQKSYDLSKKAELLYNIAVCHHNLANDGEAVRFFKRYLIENPYAEDQTKIKDSIWLAERRLRKSEKQSADAKMPKPDIREDVAFDEEKETGGRPDRRWIPFAVAGAFGAMSVASYFIANGKQNEHEWRVGELIRQGRIREQAGSLRFADAKAMRLYQGELESTDREREIWRNVAIGSLIGGAIAAGVGGFLLWKDTHGNPVKLEPKIGSQTGLLIGYQF
ncbi:MAG: tetratricopeptide repeat protein [Deltaproteobacteria bacterium]|nr:tetratricopeptide repeat protein [Deltaproteobacteria bacterium]